MARLTAKVIREALLLAGAAFMLLPFVWMLLTSLAPQSEIFGGHVVPVPNAAAAWANYAAAVTEVPLLRFIANGVLVCGAILVLQIAVAAPCGYALAKMRFRGRPLLFVGVIVALMIPIQIPAIPLYVVIARAGLVDSYLALILPWIVSAFAIFLFRQFFKSFPDEILDAARLDGFSEWSIVWRILLPAARPAIGAFAVFSVVAHWNDLYWPLVVITDPNLMTPALGITYFRQVGELGGNVGALMAGGVLVTAPLVIAFLFAQRQFVGGLAMNGPH